MRGLSLIHISKGVIRTDRPNLDERKAFFATDREGIYTLADAIQMCIRDRLISSLRLTLSSSVMISMW